MVGLVAIYKLCGLWRAIYGASITERPLGTNLKEKVVSYQLQVSSSS